MLTAKQVSDRTFGNSLRGYDLDEVDDFLHRIGESLTAWEHGKPGSVTSLDVQQVTFGTALRGYDLDEVDDFLDDVVAALRTHEQKAGRQVIPLAPSPITDAPSIPMPVTKANFPRIPTITTGARPRPEAGTPARDPADVLRGWAPDAGADQSASTRPPQTPPRSPTAPAFTTLTVTHSDSTGRTVAVLLDDQPIGKLNPGRTETFDIPAGMHWVTVKTRKHTSNVQMVEPREGDHLSLTCGHAAGEQLDDLGRAIEGISLQRVE